MDLSDLRIFSAVVSEGGVTRAAEKLHRVQSNVTTRVRQLEEDLGVDLFVRQGRRLHLAPAGRILLGYSERLLSLAEEARAAVQDSTPRGLFRLGAMESTAAVRLPPVLSLFSRHYPDVELELRTGNPVELASAVLNGDVEAALFAEPVAENRFESVPAFREEIVIVTSRDHPFAGEAGAPPATILVFETGCPHRRRLSEWYESRGDVPERIIELGSYHAMLGCVLAGMGAALLPKSVIETFPQSGLLNIHELPRGSRHLTTHLVWRKGVRSAKVRALADVLTGGEE